MMGGFCQSFLSIIKNVYLKSIVKLRVQAKLVDSVKNIFVDKTMNKIHISAHFFHI